MSFCQRKSHCFQFTKCINIHVAMLSKVSFASIKRSSGLSASCINIVNHSGKFLNMELSLPFCLKKDMVTHSSILAWRIPWTHEPINRSTPGVPVHHQLPESTQTHVHRVGDTIQPSHLIGNAQLDIVTFQSFILPFHYLMPEHKTSMQANLAITCLQFTQNLNFQFTIHFREKKT